MRRMIGTASANSTDSSMAGRTVLITGANSGLGKETAVALAAKGATTVMLCRNAERGEAALAEVKKRSGSEDVELILGDLAEPESVRGFVDEFSRRHDTLDVLVNNAGVYLSNRYTNSLGWESTYAINHLGPFLLTNLLWGALRASDAPRVVTVSSMGHRAGVLDLDDPFYERKIFFSVRAYGDTKLANVLFTRQLAERGADFGLKAYTLHPGMIATNLSHEDGGLFSVGAKLIRPVLLDVEEGAACQIWLASADDIPETSHHYYAFCKPRTPSRAARSDDKARRLWDWSAELHGL